MAQYRADGYMHLPGFVSREEFAPVQGACQADPNRSGQPRTLIDRSSNAVDNSPFLPG